MNLPDVNQYIPDIDSYIQWAVAWYDAFLHKNAISVQIVSVITGWTIPTPMVIWAWLKKRKEDGK